MQMTKLSEYKEDMQPGEFYYVSEADVVRRMLVMTPIGLVGVDFSGPHTPWHWDGNQDSPTITGPLNCGTHDKTWRGTITAGQLVED